MLQTPNFYLIRKPPGIPSTWGQEYCFLDYIKDHKSPYRQNPHSFPFDRPVSRAQERERGGFTADQEYGLLNRLDNETSGLLYFAKTQADYETYKGLQSEHLITKDYVANVYGRVRGEFGRISTPIAHHPTDEARMLALVDTDVQYRSQPQDATTYWEKLAYDEQNDITTLMLTITKGLRHQIRCHLSSLGYPIVNDALYTTKKQRKKRKKQGRYSDDGILGLMSIGLHY